MNVQTSPWFRNGLTPEERSALRAMRGDGMLSLTAAHPTGPFAGKLIRAGFDDIHVIAPTRAGVIEQLIAQVAA